MPRLSGMKHLLDIWGFPLCGVPREDAEGTFDRSAASCPECLEEDDLARETDFGSAVP